MNALLTNLTGNTTKATLIISDRRNTALGAVPVKRHFSVQLNPASLSLFSSGEAHAVSGVAPQGADGTANTPQTPQPAILTIPLVFDSANLQDAFMFEKLNPSATGIGKGIMSAAMSAKKRFSVRPIVEGLLAASKNPLTRDVQFAWSSFLFEGTIQSVTADYTMFSVSGEPIRATVSLKIAQTIGPNNMYAFCADFSEAFGLGGYNVDTVGGGKAGKWSNLLGGMSGF